jgi:hypothetical protein
LSHAIVPSMWVKPLIRKRNIAPFGKSVSSQTIMQPPVEILHSRDGHDRSHERTSASTSVGNLNAARLSMQTHPHFLASKCRN